MSYLFLFVWNERNIESDLFVTNFFKSFACAEKSFHRYWFMKGWMFSVIREFPSPTFSNLFRFSAIVIAYWKQMSPSFFRLFVALLLLSLLRRIYVWSITIDGCLIVYIMHYWNIIKIKVAAFHGLFQTCLILCKSESKSFWMISSVS